MGPSGLPRQHVKEFQEISSNVLTADLPDENFGSSSSVLRICVVRRGNVSWVRRRRSVVGLALLAGTLSACSHSGVHAQSPPASTATTATPISTSSADPEVAPAVTAYARFQAAAAQAENKPVPHPGKVASDPYTFDPLRTEYERYIWGLAAHHIAFKGPSGISHPKVTASDLTASPYPTVTVTDCLTGVARHSFNSKTGAALPDPTYKVPPPYEATSVVIEYKGVWGVKSYQVDSSRTCSA
jgi:hypothetical protein